MREINIQTGNSVSRIITGGSISQIRDLADPEKTVIITDINVDRFYSDHFRDYRKIVIGTGEAVKTLRTVEYITEELLKYGADRESFILGAGGGIVCDIAGFAASIFMRGIPFGFVSSTLLSQVDASVGGKNGVNFHGLKNMIGLFSQPDFVICDHSMFATLQEREYVNGMAELLKAAFLDQSGLLEYISDNREGLSAKVPEIVEESVYRAVCFKADVVAEDEREAGKRRILNLGHTMGHALEKMKSIPHGFAVAAGMGTAIDISVNTGLLDRKEGDMMKELISWFGLPCSLGSQAIVSDIDSLIEAASMDKKKFGDSVRFILLRGRGKPETHDMKLSTLKKEITRILNQED